MELIQRVVPVLYDAHQDQIQLDTLRFKSCVYLIGETTLTCPLLFMIPPLFELEIRARRGRTSCDRYGKPGKLQFQR